MFISLFIIHFNIPLEHSGYPSTGVDESHTRPTIPVPNISIRCIHSTCPVSSNSIIALLYENSSRYKAQLPQLQEFHWLQKVHFLGLLMVLIIRNVNLC